MKKFLILTSVLLIGCQEQKLPICKTVTSKFERNYFVTYPNKPNIQIEQTALFLVLNNKDTIQALPMQYQKIKIGDCY